MARMETPDRFRYEATAPLARQRPTLFPSRRIDERQLLPYLSALYPLTRLAIGADAFLLIARRYAMTIAGDGDRFRDDFRRFPAFLHEVGLSRDVEAVAVFDGHHADTIMADRSPPLHLSEIMDLPEASLLGLMIVRQPAMAMLRVMAPLPAIILDIYPHLAGAEAVLMTRGAGGMSVLSVLTDELDLLDAIAGPTSFGALLASFEDVSGAASPLKALGDAIGHGAIVRAFVTGTTS